MYLKYINVCKYVYIYSSLIYQCAIFTGCDPDKITTQINLKIKEIRNNRCTFILLIFSGG